MPHYAMYTTTVIGAHSVPRWYEALDRMVALGQLAEGDFADAQLISDFRPRPAGRHHGDLPASSCAVSYPTACA